MVKLWWWKTMPLATFKMILLVEDFHRDFTTLLGWSFTSTPRRRWRSRASWRGQRRTSTTTWRRIHCYGRFDFLLGVAWSEINLILCDAVGNDRRDDGDVRDIDDDVEKRGRVDNPIPSPLRIITVEIDSITWAGWFSKRIWPHIFFGFSLPGAAGVECSMAREMGNTVIFSISPDLMRISVSP